MSVSAPPLASFLLFVPCSQTMRLQTGCKRMIPKNPNLRAAAENLFFLVLSVHIVDSPVTG